MEHWMLFGLGALTGVVGITLGLVVVVWLLARSGGRFE